MWVVVACLSIAYVIVRLVNIDTSISVDEPVFLGISANFYNALAHGDFARTSQFLYPAVPIMWAGTLGFLVELPTYVHAYGQYIPSDFQGSVAPIRSIGGDPLEVLHAARSAKVLLQGSCFLIALVMLYRLFGMWVTVITSAFIIFDPFLIAHDQMLHVDGLAGISAFACMLVIAYGDRNPDRMRLWLMAGVLAALCWLTRITGLVLLPLAVLVVLDGAIGRFRRSELTGRDAWMWFCRRSGMFLAAGLVATVILWPALWVAPVDTLQFVYTEWKRSIETPHDWGLYFMGKSINGDPGMLFYVFVVLFKLTPFTMVGLAIFGVAALFRIDSVLPSRNWRPVAILGSFVAIYSLGMAAGTRKFDRYILPDFPFFDLFAAMAVVGVVMLIWQSRRATLRYAGLVFVAVLLMGQFFSSAAARPYELLYNNPLMGGLKTAEYVLMPGWGEGLDEASAWILNQPGEPPYAVRSSISPPLLTYYFPESVVVGGLGMEPSPASVWAWANTGYGITTILQWNRAVYANISDAFAGHEPVHTVNVDGREVVRVYDLSLIPPPESLITESGCSWTFDGGVTYAAIGPHVARGDSPPPAEGMLRIEVIFQTADSTKLRASYRVAGTLHARDGDAPDIPFTTTLHPNVTQRLLSRAIADVQLPSGRTLDQYWAEVSMSDGATGDTLTAHMVGDERIVEAAGKPEC